MSAVRLSERQWQALRALHAAKCDYYSPGSELLRLVYLREEDKLPDLKFGPTMCSLERRGLVERAFDHDRLKELLAGDYSSLREPERWRLTKAGMRYIADADRFKPLVRTRPAALASPHHVGRQAATVSL